MSDGPDAAGRAALDGERRFVLALGGYALEIPGGRLVTHEKLPSPQFNYVLVDSVSVERQAAFFERALDHYFQRALRPRFRLPTPVPEHLDRGLRRFGFRPTVAPRVTWLRPSAPPPPAPPGVRVDAGADELDTVVDFWTAERERPELHAALETAIHHPHPGDSLLPIVARVDRTPVSAALRYQRDGHAGLHLVSTRADARGRGAATGLVAGALARDRHPPPLGYSIASDSPRIEKPLSALGFRAGPSSLEYELPAGAELDLPPPGPPTGPRWRPPRGREA